MSTSVAALPCPFCGGAIDESDVEWPDDATCYVQCADCLAEGPCVVDGCTADGSQEDLELAALELWNRRHGRSLLRVVPSVNSASDDLHQMHEMVAALCVALGDDPAQEPCDIWRLAEHVARIKAKQ